MYQIKLSRQAQKDKKLLKQSGLDQKAIKLLKIIANDPFQTPPPYEKLVGNLQGKYSRRINIQHRILYSVHDQDKIVFIYRMWTHYQ